MSSSEPILTVRMFADHYQFYLVDKGYDHFDDPTLDWGDGKGVEQGWLASERVLCISTRAHLNDHRVRVYRGHREADYERTHEHELNISSGVLEIYGLADSDDEHEEIAVGPGRYLVEVGVASLGVDIWTESTDAEEIEDDQEYFARDDLEYYDFFLSPCS